MPVWRGLREGDSRRDAERPDGDTDGPQTDSQTHPQIDHSPTGVVRTPSGNLRPAQTCTAPTSSSGPGGFRCQRPQLAWVRPGCSSTPWPRVQEATGVCRWRSPVQRPRTLRRWRTPRLGTAASLRSGQAWLLCGLAADRGPGRVLPGRRRCAVHPRDPGPVLGRDPGGARRPGHRRALRARGIQVGKPLLREANQCGSRLPRIRSHL